MIEAYGIGAGAIVLLLAVWVAVQHAWARAFPDEMADPDVLAQRMDCRGCGCGLICQKRLAGRADSREETNS